ncbi:hypothetical protein HGRIS_009240 [Hohenbuehelia grisea]|uniref:Uncharacterized protein n=1 Tax=Hohenbuehelia grisea TaxID=104357 RepID=A0ABR3J0K3_9AGAR
MSQLQQTSAMDLPDPDSPPVKIDEYLSTLSDVDRRIYELLSCTPMSSDDVHVRPSLRGAFVKCVSQAPPHQYLASSCIPETKCDFLPPRWRYGYKFTYGEALAAHETIAPEGERIPPLSYLQEVCDESIDVKEERLMLAAWWLENRVENIIEFRHDTDWNLVWERGKKVRMFSFRDSWRVGDPLVAAHVEEISQLMFGKHVEPMWYLDASHCFWVEMAQ